MKYTVECDAAEFDFWGGAASRMEEATVAQREAVCDRLEEYFNGSTEATKTDVNDFVWFECDDIFDEEGEDAE